MGEVEKWPRVEIPSLRQDEGRGRGVAWFRVWPWQLLDKVEGKRGGVWTELLGDLSLWTLRSISLMSGNRFCQRTWSC